MSRDLNPCGLSHKCLKPAASLLQACYKPATSLLQTRSNLVLTGTAAERVAFLEAQAKEERVELLRRQIGRRMLNAGLARGFSAWTELWEVPTL